METSFPNNMESEVSPPAEHNVQRSSISKVIFGILMALAFLLPIFFIPVLPIPLIFAKHGLFALLVSIGIILWSIEAIKTGSITWSKSPLLLMLGALVLISAASSLMSTAFKVSFLGLGGELDTTLAIMFFSVFAYLSAEYADSIRRIMSIVLAVMASFLVLAVYEALRFFLPSDVLSFGFFFSPITTPLGGWHNLAVFSGLIGILLVAFLDMLSLNKIFSAIAVVLLVISLAFMAVVNFSLTWILVALFSVAILAYETSSRLKNKKPGASGEGEAVKQRRISIPQTSLVVFIVSVFFFFAGGALSSFVTDYFNLSYIETRPSWSSTLEIEKESLNYNPVLGAGPNRFKQMWDKYRPEEVNQTQFWNADYSTGVGYIPTFAVTHGVLGILIWLAIGASLLLVSIRVLFKSSSALNRFISTSIILSALYLWLTSFLYVPGYVLIAFLFLFMGLSLALLGISEPSSRKHFVFVEKVNVAFVTIFLLALVLLGGLWVGYTSLRQSASVAYFRSGLASAGATGDFNLGIERVNRALNLYESDLYYRSLAEMTVRNLDANLASATSQEQVQAVLQNILPQSVGLARGAVDYDSENVDNWLSLAAVYEYMLQFGVEGSFDAAFDSYEEVEKRDPITPTVNLAYARLALAAEAPADAENYINEALEKKPDYTDALLLLSQMSLGEGDTEGALQTMTLAALSSPQNADIYLNMGILLYQQQRFEEAVPILERAVLINPFYANAKYFLGLSYYEAGRVQDAILQFEDIRTLNPDNTSVTEILENLKSGSAPFAE